MACFLLSSRTHAAAERQQRHKQRGAAPQVDCHATGAPVQKTKDSYAVPLQPGCLAGRSIFIPAAPAARPLCCAAVRGEAARRGTPGVAANQP